MSSAICLNLDQSKILSSGNGLTLSYTIPTFENMEKGENAGFPSMFSTIPIKERNQQFNNIKYLFCKCFQFGQGPNFVVW